LCRVAVLGHACMKTERTDLLVLSLLLFLLFLHKLAPLQRRSYALQARSHVQINIF